MRAHATTAHVYTRITSSARCFATVHKLSGTRVRTYVRTYVCTCIHPDERPAEIILESRCEQDAIYIFNGYRERLARATNKASARERERGRKKGRQKR